ncbi:MAG TPA: hypothetical protein VFZ59_20660 [Verrucomicrobiae bacterium]|nr:hypothetical protein [Verrucomicrobiae bacterium]
MKPLEGAESLSASLPGDDSNSLVKFRPAMKQFDVGLLEFCHFRGSGH